VKEEGKRTPPPNLRVDCIEQLLEESFTFNNCFNVYAGFTSILKVKLSPKFTMPNIKFHGTKNPNHYVRHFINVMTLKGINKDNFHIIFPFTSYSLRLSIRISQHGTALWTYGRS